MPVITIGRGFGAGGETVGPLVAQRLNLKHLDSKIVDEVGRRLRVGTEVVEGRRREAVLADMTVSEPPPEI